MFEQFGEMNSSAEINLLADNLKKEKDFDSIRKLAAENGIDPEDAEDYIESDDESEVLCNVLSAAIGKINMEAKELDCKELMADWVDWIRIQCSLNDEDFLFARNVRKKGKSLAGALGAVLKKSWEIKWKVPEKIVKAAGVSGARVEFGVPGTATVRKIIQEYYGGETK